MLSESILRRLYGEEFLSSKEIAQKLGCSVSQVNYWLSQYHIQKRSISDASYRKWNPKGDPFAPQMPQTVPEGILYGMGLGFYWGEGNKRNTHSVRLGNSDPKLILTFIKFLEHFYKIDSKKLRFGLQVFGDMDPNAAVSYWAKLLKTSHKKFHKVTVTPHRGIGNYRRKTKYGVLTVHFNNKKLRDIICRAIEESSLV